MTINAYEIAIAKVAPAGEVAIQDIAAVLNWKLWQVIRACESLGVEMTPDILAGYKIKQDDAKRVYNYYIGYTEREA